MKVITKIVLSFLLFINTSVVIFLFISGYYRSIKLLISLFEFERYSKQIFHLINADKFLLLELALVLISMVLSLMILFIDFIYGIVRIYIYDLSSAIKAVVGYTFRSSTKYLLIIPCLTYLYFAYQLPISYDEAWTYLNFTEKNPLVALSYYPAPNNHILHSLITSIIYYMPLLSPILKLRISAIFIGLCTICVVSYSLKSHFNKRVSILTSAISSMLSMGIYYGYMSRGYGIVLLCFVLSFHFTLNIICRGNKTRDWVWLSLFSSLGFFTMPSFLYPFVTLHFIILLNNNFQIKKQFIAGIATIIIVLLLYTPVILVNGLSAITSNKYVNPISRLEVLQRLSYFLCSSLDDIFGINWGIIVGIILLGGILLFLHKKKLLLQIFSIFILAPSVLLLAHAVIPFSRTFYYYGFLIIFFFFLSIDTYLAKVPERITLGISIALQILLLFNFSHIISQIEEYSINSKNVIEKIKYHKHYLVNSALFETYLLYELKSQGIKNYHIQYYPRKPINVDSCFQKYDVIIVDNLVNLSPRAKPTLTTKDYAVYISPK